MSAAAKTVHDPWLLLPASPVAQPGCGLSDSAPSFSDAAPHETGQPVAFELNGRPVRIVALPERRLLTILREDLRLTGAKPGCGIGRCGACMVWLDGRPVNACLVMAWQLEGRRVTTVEAIATHELSVPVRQALAECGGLQCGYCTPGILVTLTHLYTQSPRPDSETVLSLMTGHLCRCTGYAGITRTIQRLFGEDNLPAG